MSKEVASVSTLTHQAPRSRILGFQREAENSGASHLWVRRLDPVQTVVHSATVKDRERARVRML